MDNHGQREGFAIVTNTFTADTALSAEDIEENLEEARARYAQSSNYGVGGLVHSGSTVANRVSPDLTSEYFTFRQAGLGAIDLTGLGAVLVMGAGSTFAAGTPVITLSCLDLPDALGPVNPTWTWSGLGTDNLFVLSQVDAALSGEPNKLLPGLLYKVELTNTGTPGVADWAEFGLYTQRYPIRGGGI